MANILSAELEGVRGRFPCLRVPEVHFFAQCIAVKTLAGLRATGNCCIRWGMVLQPDAERCSHGQMFTTAAAQI